MKTLRNILLTFILFSASGCTLFGVWGLNRYSAEPFEAQVIDADTKQPLEGVIVVADWVLYGGLHYDEVGVLEIMETVTDENGRFALPSWGPKIAIKGQLRSKYPSLVLAKRGYDHHVTSRKGGQIEMKKFQGSDVEYGKRLGGLPNLIYWAYRGDNCEWQKTPRMISFVHQEDARLYALGIRTTAKSVFSVSEKGCGSAYEFFKSYIPELRDRTRPRAKGRTSYGR